MNQHSKNLQEVYKMLDQVIKRKAAKKIISGNIKFGKDKFLRKGEKPEEVSDAEIIKRAREYLKKS